MAELAQRVFYKDPSNFTAADVARYFPTDVLAAIKDKEKYITEYLPLFARLEKLASGDKPENCDTLALLCCHAAWIVHCQDRSNANNIAYCRRLLELASKLAPQCANAQLVLGYYEYVSSTHYRGVSDPKLADPVERFKITIAHAQQAIKHFEQCQAITDPNIALNAYNQLGLALLRLGQQYPEDSNDRKSLFQQAWDTLKVANGFVASEKTFQAADPITLAKLLFDAEGPGEIRCQGNIAQVVKASGDIAQAKQCIEKAYRDIDRGSFKYAYMGMSYGEILMEEYKQQPSDSKDAALLKQAADILQASYDIYYQVGVAHKPNQNHLRLLIGLGNVHWLLKDNKAENYLKQAIELFTQVSEVGDLKVKLDDLSKLVQPPLSNVMQKNK